MPIPALLAAGIPAVGSIVSGIFERRAAKRAAEEAARARAAAAENIVTNYGTVARDVGAASGTAQGQITGATTEANRTLGDVSANLGGVNQGIQANVAPYMGAGTTGVGTLTDLSRRPEFRYEDYASGPAFDFLMQQGGRAIENSASARGIAQSGNTLKDLTTFGQGLAATHYQDAFDRYNQGIQNQLNIGRSLTDVGLRGTQIGTNAALDTGRLQAGIGEQQAANTVGSGYANAGITTNTAQYLGNLGTQAGEQANLINVGGGDIRAAGTMATGAANVGMVNNTANNLPALLEAILGRRRPGAGGYAVTGDIN
jgi:hypothetical protein